MTALCKVLIYGVSSGAGRGRFGIWWARNARRCPFSERLRRTFPCVPPSSSKSALHSIYPTGDSSIAILCSMLPKSRRVRWLSARSNQYGRLALQSSLKIARSSLQVEISLQLRIGNLFTSKPFFIGTVVAPVGCMEVKDKSLLAQFQGPEGKPRLADALRANCRASSASRIWRSNSRGT